MTRKRKTALVTGASSGIGYEIARLFALSGYHIVAVARNKEKLNQAARDFKKIGAHQVTVITKDLSEEGAASEVFEYTEARELSVDVLINDAGVGEHGLFHTTDMVKQNKVIRLNINALVEMTRLYLPGMLERGEGKILQVASIASYQPMPLLSVYAASKAFVLSFTDALINEIQGSGVTMTALIPNATDTEFFKRAHAEKTVAANSKLEDPGVVAKVAYEALMKGESHALAPGVASQILMSSLLPNEKVAALARKQMEEVKENS